MKLVISRDRQIDRSDKPQSYYSDSDDDYDYSRKQKTTVLLDSAISERKEQKYTEALVFLNKVQNLKEFDYDIALLYRGDTNRMLGEYKTALKDLDQYMQLRHFHSEDYSAALACRGAVHRQLKNYQRAHEDLTQAIKQNNQNYFAFYERASLLQEENKFENALKDFQLCLQNKPTLEIELKVLISCSEIYLSQKNLKKVEFALSEWRRLNRQHQNPYIEAMSGEWCFLNGEFKKTIDQLGFALTLKPTLDVNNYILSIRGAAYLEIAKDKKDEEKSLQQAREDLNQAIHSEREKIKIFALSRLADLNQISHKYEDALGNIESCLQLNPDSTLKHEVLYIRAYIYCVLKKYSEADNDLKELIKKPTLKVESLHRKVLDEKIALERKKSNNSLTIATKEEKYPIPNNPDVLQQNQPPLMRIEQKSLSSLVQDKITTRALILPVGFLGYHLYYRNENYMQPMGVATGTIALFLIGIELNNLTIWGSELVGTSMKNTTEIFQKIADGLKKGIAENGIMIVKVRWDWVIQSGAFRAIIENGAFQAIMERGAIGVRTIMEEGAITAKSIVERGAIRTIVESGAVSSLINFARKTFWGKADSTINANPNVTTTATMQSDAIKPTCLIL